MKFEDLYAPIIEKFPEFINQKQMCEICGFSQKTARIYELRGIINSTLIQNPRNLLIRERKIRLLDVLTFLYHRECREELDSDFIGTMKQYYVERFLSYDDLLIIENIEEMTGFRASAITNWINKHGLIAFKRGRRFLIPKAALIDFMINPYYRLIKNKSNLQRKCILEYENAFYGGKSNG